jgi:hypothetical protein
MEITKLPIIFELTENYYLKCIHKDSWKHYLVTPSGKIEIGLELLQRFSTKGLLDKDVVQLIANDK